MGEQETKKFASEAEVIELSQSSYFMDKYVENMMFNQEELL